MQMKRWVPGVSVAEPTVVEPPAGTNRGGPKKYVGGVGVPNRIRFSPGTIPPPPNCVVCVSVCVSPPRFMTESELTESELPASIVTCFGEKRHAPANLWSTSCAMKSSNVVPPR